MNGLMLALSVWLASGAAAPPVSPAPAAAPAWLDFGPALVRAESEKKPVLLQFYTTWCGYCRKMEQETFRDPSVLEGLGGVVAVRVDAEELRARAGYRGAELADRYRIETYPTHVMVDAAGREIMRAVGYQGPRPFLAWLRAAQSRSKLPPPAL